MRANAISGPDCQSKGNSRLQTLPGVQNSTWKDKSDSNRLPEVQNFIGKANRGK